VFHFVKDAQRFIAFVFDADPETALKCHTIPANILPFALILEMSLADSGTKNIAHSVPALRNATTILNAFL
jgi:hypothetical protein